jgi:hypothetical protein
MEECKWEKGKQNPVEILTLGVGKGGELMKKVGKALWTNSALFKLLSFGGGHPLVVR